MMVEGDVWVNDMGEPFVGDHCEQSLGSVSLMQWLEAFAHADKGVKLDFHMAQAVQPALAALVELNPTIPVMLHADIFRLLDDDAPFEPEMFVHLAHEFFPSATLSIGWSLTREQDKDGRLEEALIQQMSAFVLDKLGGLSYTIEFQAGYTSGWERGAAILLEPINEVERPDYGSNVIDGITLFRKSTFEAA